MTFFELPFFDPDTEDMYIVEVSVIDLSETSYWDTGRHTTDNYDYTVESCLLDDEPTTLPDWITSRMIEEGIEDCLP